MIARRISYLLISLIMASMALATETARITVNVADVSVTTEDSIAIVPVYLTNTIDSLAGIELYFKIENNRVLNFASDEVGASGMSGAVDTAGSLLSGWEWIGISSLENSLFDLKIAGMADWPDGSVQPPMIPQKNGILVYLRLRIDREFTRLSGGRHEIRIIREKSGFSDKVGNSIGVITKIEKQCQEMAGDSCLKWSTVRVGIRDTIAVKLINGSVTIIDESILEEK